VTAPATRSPHDPFYWLGEINKASAVMVVERGIVPALLGGKIADAIRSVLADGERPGAARSGNYLIVEEALIKHGRPDVTRLHAGRSRQDISATIQRLAMREDLLDAFDKLAAARVALLAIASKSPHAILPAYTWGVQAQPVTLGHYLSAYAAALERAAERLRQAYARLNLCPLGSAALGTSSFPVDRPRLAGLLGFDGMVENSLDATQISPIDTGAEAAGIASASALTIGTFIADVTQQYAQAKPWISLIQGELTGTSSIMPQKRNPSGLVFLRAQASIVVGHAQTFLLTAHNVAAGMSDYKPFINPKQGDQPNNVMRELADLFDGFARLLRTLVFDEKRARAEVDADYSTTTELADTLQREADIPFRVGHHFASELVNFGRANDLKPGEIPYAQARRIYAEAAAHFGLDNVELPLGEAAFRRSLTAENMVAASKGLGGPQPAEVARMLGAHEAHLAADRTWLAATHAKLADAARGLNRAFASLDDGVAV
jgi:argininosuccinate lyase